MNFGRKPKVENGPYRSTRWGPTSLLRSIDIGPRLILLAGIPLAALLLVIGLLASDDIARWQDLRRFHETTEEIDGLVNLNISLQEERHLLLGDDTQTVLERPLSGAPSGELAETLREIGSPVDVIQVLADARRLSAAGQSEAAALEYTRLINEVLRGISLHTANAPFGNATSESQALNALLQSHESFLLEDLQVQIGDPDPLALGRFRTEALLALEEFATNASAQSRADLEAITTTSAWRFLTLARVDSFADVDDPSQAELWARSADVRRLAFIDLAEQESETLNQSVGLAQRQVAETLVTVLAVIGAIVLLATLLSVLLRRSIVRPLSNLTVSARTLSKGEMVPIDDPASDEIAEVAGAFSSLAETMENLFTDIDAISFSVRDGRYDQRIHTDHLMGDWARLANTMNATLETSAAHRDATREELDRRTVLSEISNAAILAVSSPEITASVLHHLPKALAGSHAHIHVHPSGPPTVDLGIPLEKSLSALEVPTLVEQAQRITSAKGDGVAALVEFPSGPPAVIALMFGEHEPAQLEPLVSLVETAARILSQAHRRQIAETDATHSREHDQLTGLFNAERLGRWFADRRMVNEWTAVGIAPQNLDDLDGSFGRNARNLVLQAVGKRLETIVAQEFRAHGYDGALARIVEPEFVAVVPKRFSRGIADTIAQRFGEPIEIEGSQLQVDLTIGLTEVGRTDVDLTQAVANVAIAIRRGASQTTEIIPFEARYRDDVRRRTQLISWLEQAIENRDLRIEFQPIVNAITTRTEGYECLVRGSMNGEAVSPAEFIPLAEETNMVVAIGEFVLREACAALPFLRGDTPYVAINLSPVELSDPRFIGRIDRVLSESSIDRDRIVFEVTEGATATESDLERLHRLRRLGVQIAIDDFGSGQSNLSYLNNLPAQILKLDRSLITPITSDEGAVSIVGKAIEMAHGLGMTVIGEGVEQNDELNILRRLRCDRIQGWFTGRPAPLEDFIEITVDRPVTQISRPRHRT